MDILMGVFFLAAIATLSDRRPAHQGLGTNEVDPRKVPNVPPGTTLMLMNKSDQPTISKETPNRS